MQRSFFEWVVFIVSEYGAWFVRGAGITLLIAIVGTIVGSLIGLIIGAIKSIPYENHRSNNGFRKFILKIVRGLLNIYIEVFRGTPMMVQSMIIFYGMKQAFNIDMDPLFAGMVIVSINTGAYMAEIVRGGIESIDQGQVEAAYAIGMTHFQAMITVILPQAIRNILPAIGNEFVINIKDTSVLNVISVTELFFQAKSVQGIMYRTFETFSVASVVYLVLTYSVTKILRFVEKKMDGPASYTVLASSTMPNNVRKTK